MMSIFEFAPSGTYHEHGPLAANVENPFSAGICHVEAVVTYLLAVKQLDLNYQNMDI